MALISTYPQTHRLPARRPHVNLSLVAIVGLAAALIGLAAWVLVDQTRAHPTQGVASSRVTAMLDDELAALNSGNAKAIAAFFTPTAVLDDRVAPLVTTGNDQIGRVVAGYVNDMGMQLEAVGPVIQYGRTVARFAQAPRTTNQSSGFMLVYRLAPSGKISHEWVLVAGSEKTDAAG